MNMLQKQSQNCQWFNFENDTIFTATDLTF